MNLYALDGYRFIEEKDHEVFNCKNKENTENDFLKLCPQKILDTENKSDLKGSQQKITTTFDEKFNWLIKDKLFSVDENLNIGITISFDQRHLIKDYAQINNELPEKLGEIDLKYDGLCELICNKVLIGNLLGRDDKEDLKREITIDKLNQESIIKSHLLNIYSVFNKMVAFLFGIYPDNILSVKDQWDLVKDKKVNEAILFKGLNSRR